MSGSGDEDSTTMLLSDASGQIDRLVSRARALLQDARLAEAAAACEAALDIDPKHAEALYTLIVIERYRQNFDRALSLVDHLVAIDPTNGRAYQERGHCLRDRGNMDAALTAYQDAVSRNSALVGSWTMLATIHADAGRAQAADMALAQRDYLGDLPPELLSVASLIQEGRVQKAENLCRHFLQTNGHHVEGMRLLADIGTKFSALEEAEFLLQSAVVLAPDNTGAHFDYVGVLNKRQKFAEALAAAADLRAKEPGNPQLDMLYANQHLAVGNFDEALGIYQRQATETPNNPGIHLTMGHALKTIGRLPDAIAAYSRAYTVRADFGDAYWSLANLKTYRFSGKEIAEMRAIEDASTTQLVDRYHLCFALGKALEDQGAYADSFIYYERGNRLKREEVRYEWTRIDKEMQLQADHCGGLLLDAKKGAGCKAPDPIFIVGLPRAGSTLLEQILASHSQVEGTMELPNILALAHKIDGRRRVGEEARYPANLGELTAEELTGFGEAYLRDTAIHRKQGTPFFIDKMPNNFRHIGLIHLILPNAKIIDARRDAMSCCFSGFKQLFAEGQEFTYGLEEVGRYFKGYVDLMAHWNAVLPGKVLRIQYEDVVADLEAQVRLVLDYIGLPFEEACMNFHQSARAVRTPSSEQVRQPIFTSGLDQWENYAPYLAPLRAALGAERVSE
jgi:tetratricopeptide (TPR) repeat protein